MTTVPSMFSELSAVRMASTAAWSAAFSSPRPISREAASAAASVTRTTSSARLRSIIYGLPIVSRELLDRHDMRRLDDRRDLAELLDHARDLRLAGLMGGENDRHPIARRARTLDHRFQRNILVAHDGRDFRDDAGPVDHHHAEIEGAHMAAFGRRRDLLQGL